VKVNVSGALYRVYGYKAKQVRDNIHACDVVRLIEMFLESPRSGEVYNVGGGRGNSCSILEAFEMIEALSGLRMNFEYVDQNRKGDHICYISDLSKIRSHPGLRIFPFLCRRSSEEIYQSWTSRGGRGIAAPAG
jgi:CDP-paratose 2-epimerase